MNTPLSSGRLFSFHSLFCSRLAVTTRLPELAYSGAPLPGHPYLDLRTWCLLSPHVHLLYKNPPLYTIPTPYFC